MNPPDSEAVACAARLRGAAALLARRMRPSPQRGGVSVAKLSVLGHLWRLGPMTPTGIAQREGVKLQSLTRLLGELESEGWLARKTDPEDGRRSLMSLTSFGVRRLSLAVRGGETSLAVLIQTTLEPAQRALLLDACQLIEGLAEALNDSPPDAKPKGVRSRKPRP